MYKVALIPLTALSDDDDDDASRGILEGRILYFSASILVFPFSQIFGYGIVAISLFIFVEPRISGHHKVEIVSKLIFDQNDCRIVSVNKLLKYMIFL